MRKLLSKLCIALILAITTFSIFTFEIYKYTDSEILARQSEGYLDATNNIKYRDNDVVETIVVLEDDSLITRYDETKYDSISEYISSSKGKKIADKLLEKQNEIINDIKACNIEIDMSNSYNYTVVMNAVSLKTKVKNLDKIAELMGVKDVIVSNYYEAFEVESENKELEDVSYTDVFMDSDKAWELGYTGEGMVVAVIDTGTDVNHEAFMGDIENPKYTKEELNELIGNLELSAKGVTSADVVYHSEKIPYAFDYAGNDSYAYSAGLDHGTHVAGIVGANSGKIRGVAVDAQIIVMKVFDDMGSAFETYILAGVEDSLKLGVDVANMSLGSPCGNSYATEQAAKVYSQVRDKGVNLVVAAGNDSYLGINNMAQNHLPMAKAPDYGVVASPSTYEYALSVASLDNNMYTTICLNFENKVYVEYAQTSNSFPIGTILDGQTLDFVEIPNIGSEADYAGIDVNGKVAMVARGTISFTEKHDAAVKAGAVAMIVYDTSGNSLLGMQIENQKIPAVFISNVSYNKIKAANVSTISIKNNDLHIVENPTAGQISQFSSWGTTLSLEIKPEITGPGGFINSSVGDNQYAEYSGTSMAAPNVAGVSALIRQYVKEKYPELTNTEVVDVVNQLLMSTANPIIGANGTYTSVRAQGAGVANAYDALTVNAMLYVNDCARPKAEMGSSKQGVYSYTMKVENIGSSAITYTLNTKAITDEYVEYEGEFYSTTTSRELTPEDITITYSSNVVDNKITVNSGQTVEITVNMELSEEYKNSQDEIFINGSYVEGFTFLQTETDQELVVPFLGFYGDFDKLPIMEGIPYEDKKGINLMGSVAAIFNASQTGYELGYNIVTEDFYKDYIYYSCSNMQKNVLTSYNVLNRNIDFAKFVITDEAGEIVYEAYEVNYKKGCYSSNAGTLLSCYDYEGWDGTKKDGTKAVNGEKYTYTTTLGYYEEDGETIRYSETWSFDFKIDSIAPEFKKYDIVYEDDKAYLDVYVDDNVSTCYAVIYSYDLKYQLSEAVANVNGKQQSTFRFSLDEIIDSMNENNVNPSQIKVEVYDWAYNFIYENIVLGPSSIKLDSEYKVAVNGTKSLQPTLIPANIDSKSLKYESADERIATVDANGVITGVSTGETTITIKAANGVTATAKVIVGGQADTGIEISNGNISLTVGSAEFLEAKITPENAIDKTVMWYSSNEEVATVSSYGRVLGISAGEATITAISANGHKATINVIVNHEKVSSLFLYSSYSIMFVGDEKRIEKITVTPYIEGYSNVIFSSSDDSIMSVSSSGVLTAHKEGRVTIYAKSPDGTMSSYLDYIVCNVSAIKVNAESQVQLLMDSTYQINATVNPENTTFKDLIYKSNNPDVAVVDENGLVTPVNIGTAEIEISCGKATTKCYVTVLPQMIESISSNEQFISLIVDQQHELQINVNPTNVTFKKLFYSSSNEDVATVVNGVVKAISAGTSTITVSSVNGVKYSFYVVVSSKEVVENIREDFENITLNETDKSHDLGLSTDEETLIYSSDNDLVAVVSNGKVYVQGSGKCTIYVYNHKQLIDTFTVEINEVAEKETGCGCSSSSVVIMLSIAISCMYLIIRKKH